MTNNIIQLKWRVILQNTWLLLDESVKFIRNVGNGSSTFFWLSTWIGGSPLSLLFPRLFSLSNQKSSMVNEFFVRDVDGGRWCFAWRRNLFQWELDLLGQLIELLLERV
jgi:hypothetical protein